MAAPRLLLMDVDSTLIKEEVIDLLAARAGVGAEVAAITERAMQGELDFSESLAHRVSLLAGLNESALHDVRTDIHLSEGAEVLIATLQAHQIKVGVVSGGFMNVIAPLANSLHLDFARANQLEILDGVLTGRTTGPVITRAAKAEALKEFAAENNIALNETIAVGDGANDLDMLELAGIGIAFNAKPKVQEAADVSITNGRLDEILNYFGIPREKWVVSNS